MYNSTTGPNAATSGGGGNWNSWGLQTPNSGSAASSKILIFFSNLQ